MSETTPPYGEYEVIKECPAPAQAREWLGMDRLFPGMSQNLTRAEALPLLEDRAVRLVRELGHEP